MTISNENIKVWGRSRKFVGRDMTMHEEKKVRPTLITLLLLLLLLLLLEARRGEPLVVPLFRTVFILVEEHERCTIHVT